jgi:methylenetetrahydrofolate reductase (NADPH)
MRIDQMLAERRPVISFEFFPPKSEEAQQNLEVALAALKEEQPDYVSVTYGAGGATRERTVEISRLTHEGHGLETMTHLSCVGEPTDRLVQILTEIQSLGIENVLALRGDPPRGQTEWEPHPEGLEWSIDLIRLIREQFDFCVGAACFPEVHPDAPDLAHDLRYAKEKVDAGADFLICQLFFDNAMFFDFVKEARAAGITVPIIPGIMPIADLKQIKMITGLCGATIPPDLGRELDRVGEDPTSVAALGTTHAALQCSDLLARGAPGIHVYTLNRAPATRAILGALRASSPWERAKDSV